MTIDFTAFRDAFTSLIEQITTMQDAVSARANAERVEMLDLLGRMQKTQEAAHEVGRMCGEMSSTLAEASVVSNTLADKIVDALDDPMEFCPNCAYENLVGYCAECGDELTVEDDYIYDEDQMLICAACEIADEDESEDEDEDEDESKQMELPL